MPMVLTVGVIYGMSLLGSIPSETFLDPDCGRNALYVLLRLERQSVPMERLVAALPKPNVNGFSMAELASASGALGLSLEGLDLASYGRRPDRPIIIFLKRKGLGHFAVLRPVGTTGKMVQLIDPPYPPQVLDYDRLTEMENWTNFALIASDSWVPNVKLFLASCVLGGMLCSFSAWWLSFLKRRRPAGPSHPEVVNS